VIIGNTRDEDSFFCLQFGLGITAVMTVMCSLAMSIGICTAFGVVPTLMAVYAKRFVM
jgi:hypothetical protein